MHTEILDKNQQTLLPWISKFNRTFYLAGGTAIALHIGHRRSIDFDLFTASKLNKYRIKSKLNDFPFKQITLFEDIDQLHIQMHNVKLTFFNYPFAIRHSVKMGSYFTMPTLLTLGAMKAFAFGLRAKWKDYVDMYFILRDHFTVKDICNEADKCFSSHFSEKMFRQQLAFHKDIDYSEQIDYIIPEVAEDKIKKFLIEKATDIG